MGTKSNLDFTLPPGSDKQFLKRFLLKSENDQAKLFKKQNDGLLKQAKLLGRQKPLSKDVSKRIVHHPFDLKAFSKRQKNPDFTPLKGHNPARYAPFDFSSYWEYNSPGSQSWWNFPFGNYGPEKTTGLIGSSIGNLSYIYYVMSAVTRVGFLYYAPADATLHITAQAQLSGFGSSWDSEVYAGLVLSAEHFLRRNPVSTSLDIFRSGFVHEAGDANEYIYSYGNFSHDRPQQREGRTISLLTPVRKFNWYIISISANQYLLGPGISYFSFYVGPVSCVLV